MSSVFVTGPNGFVGQNLLHRLLEKNHQVTAAFRSEKSLTDFSLQQNSTLPPQSKTAAPDQLKKIVVHDLATTTVDLVSLLKNHDCVVHLAARVHQMNETSEDPLKIYRQQNVEATLRLAEAAKKAEVKRFIFISTIKVNGEETKLHQPFSASDQPHPTDPYSISKAEAEAALLKMHQPGQFEVVILRPPLIYGPQPKANLRLLLKLATSYLPLPFASIKNRRSLVSVFNFCDVIEICVQHPKAAGEVFLVADPEPFSLPQLIKLLAESKNKTALLFSFPEFLILFGLRVLGLKAFSQRLFGHLEVNTEKTLKTLNWQPRFDFKKTVQTRMTT